MICNVSPSKDLTCTLDLRGKEAVTRKDTCGSAAEKSPLDLHDH